MLEAPSSRGVMALIIIIFLFLGKAISFGYLEDVSGHGKGKVKMMTWPKGAGHIDHPRRELCSRNPSRPEEGGETGTGHEAIVGTR